MAHTKAGGARAGQGGNVAGKRLGVKVSGGGIVKNGQIIVRQRGRTFLPGANVYLAKDFTIHAAVDGRVEFKYASRGKKKINVIPA